MNLPSTLCSRREFSRLLPGSLLAASGACGRLLAGQPAAGWPHWRGPRRNGVATQDSGWERGAWPLRTPAWTAECGVGASSPVVSGGRVYVSGWAGGKETVACLDVATGAALWSSSYTAPAYGRFAVGDQNFYSGPGSTPELDPDGGRLFTLGSDGDLNCWSTRERPGTRLWGHNLYERYQVPRRPQATRRGASLRDYGYTTAPLVYREWLLVEAGAPEGAVIAFDAATGQERWRSEARTAAGHTGGPALMEVEGLPCVLVMTVEGLLVVRLDDGAAGKTLASYPWVTDFANNVASPAVEGNSVLITSGYNQAAMERLRVTRAGISREWRSPLHSGVCTPVIHRGRVYWAARGLKCLDFRTGELLWEGGRFGDTASCLVTADSRLLVWANEGDLALVETAERSPKAYRELGSLTGLSRTEAWPHVVAADGRLFCKDRKGRLWCFKL